MKKKKWIFHSLIQIEILENRFFGCVLSQGVFFRGSQNERQGSKLSLKCEHYHLKIQKYMRTGEKWVNHRLQAIKFTAFALSNLINIYLIAKRLISSHLFA